MQDNSQTLLIAILSALVAAGLIYAMTRKDKHQHHEHDHAHPVYVANPYNYRSYGPYHGVGFRRYGRYHRH